MLKKQKGYDVLVLVDNFTQAIDAAINDLSKKSPDNQEKDRLKDAELLVSRISDKFLRLTNELNSLTNSDDARPSDTAVYRAEEFFGEYTEKAQHYIDIITSNEWNIDEQASELLAEYETDSNNMRNAINNARATLER